MSSDDFSEIGEAPARAGRDIRSIIVRLDRIERHLDLQIEALKGRCLELEERSISGHNQVLDGRQQGVDIQNLKELVYQLIEAKLGLADDESNWRFYRWYVQERGRREKIREEEV